MTGVQTCALPIYRLERYLWDACEYFPAGGHSVHRDMEEGAELAHGDKEIGGQQQDQQAAGKRDLPGGVLRRRQDNPERRAAVGDEIHDRDRVELHDENLHRDFMEFFRLFVHLGVFKFVCLINLELKDSELI